MHTNSSATIFVLATPIGNLDDLSARAIKTLKEVDFIAAEDTRHTKQLLSKLDIHKKELISYHDHNESERSEQIIRRLLASNESVALVSDAGTPAISDPGYRLVRAAHAAKIRVVPIPGPSALATLVSCSGLPSQRLLFVGFLPTKAQALETEIKGWQQTGASIVFYETPRRFGKSLGLIAEHYPGATLTIGRELTKLYEEIEQMSIDEAKEWCKVPSSLKGELVVMVSIPKASLHIDEADLSELAKKRFGEGASLKDLLSEFRDRGLSRAELYQLLLSAKHSDE